MAPVMRRLQHTVGKTTMDPTDKVTPCGIRVRRKEKAPGLPERPTPTGGSGPPKSTTAVDHPTAAVTVRVTVTRPLEVPAGGGWNT